MTARGQGSDIVVVGAGGRLGAAVARHLREEGHGVSALSHADLDLADPAAVRRVLEPMAFGVLFNSAAFTQVDECERQPELAHAVNARAPALLAEIARIKGARFVHVSTDYVYAGDDERPRREDDPADPLSAYGRSKLAGDEAVLSTDPSALVLRTSWVFGPDRPSFLDMMIDRARDQDSVAAIADKSSTPCYSEDFARFVVPLLRSPEGGIVNVCNAGACTWQEYAQHALHCAHAAGIALKTTEVGALNLADFPHFLAPRPRFTAMDTAKLARVTGLNPRPWQEAVDAFVRDHLAARAARASH